ncbi:leucine-rich repeat-containing protein 24-like [Mytilus trossulus]|uniref:leucine-rich repeat-containing protein 24-like n=1 Tax=Mytilus trossulus TaxID=6551 RepID=UPI003007DCB0
MHCNTGIIFHVFIFFIVISLSFCEKRCTLSYENEIHIANCSGIGLNHIPFELHHNIKILDLRNNGLKVIGANAFAKYDMLTQLYLQNNSLQEIKANAFAQLTQLKHLDLSVNQLTSVPTSAFPGLTSLLVLNFKGNKFSHLEDAAFTGLPSLTSLYLDGNYIEYVGNNAFEELSYLQTLELQNNNLKTLSEESVQYFTKQFKSFKLYNNPWFCDCRIRWLQQYLHNSSYHSLIHWIFPEGEPQCNSPSLVKDKSFSQLDESDFVCEIIMYSSNQDLTIKPKDKIELYCNYYADPYSSPKWTKNGMELTSDGLYGQYSIDTKQESMIYSTLTILDFSANDMGQYKCSVENARSSGSLKFTLSLEGHKFDPSIVKPSPIEEQKNSRNNHTIKITLSVVGGFLLLLVLIGMFIYMLLRFRRKHQRKLEERSQTFKEHLKTNVLNQSDITESEKYDKKPPVNGDMEIMECEPLYAQVRKDLNPNNTYVSFQGEFNDPEDNGGFSSSTNQTKGSDSSQCESTSPLLDDCSPIPCESHDLLYDPSHGAGSYYHTPQRAQTLNSRFLPSLSSYETYDTYLSYSTPYSTLSRNGNNIHGSHNGSYYHGPHGHYPMNGTHTLPLNSANRIPHKSASTSYIGPLPPKKPPRVFHSRDSMSLSQTSSSAGSEPSHTTKKLSLPKPGTVDSFGTAV